MKVTNDLENQQLIEHYKEKYLEQYTTGRENAGDKDYFKTIFQRDILEKNKNTLCASIGVSEALRFRNEKKWLDNLDEFSAIKEFCKLNKQNLPIIVRKVAEYEAIILVWDEINKPQQALETNETNKKLSSINPSFTLKENVISKIDFIRIINVLCELRAFENSDGTYPTKQDTMKTFGSIVGIDLSNYDKDLSKALGTTKLETNIDIFEKMKTKATSIFTDKASK